MRRTIIMAALILTVTPLAAQDVAQECRAGVACYLDLCRAATARGMITQSELDHVVWVYADLLDRLTHLENEEARDRTYGRCVESMRREIPWMHKEYGNLGVACVEDWTEMISR